MCLREEGDSPFIGEQDGANPTSNQCGIALFFKKQQRPRKIVVLISFILRG